MNSKIRYLFHSGFSVETENYFLVFDYYMDYPHFGDKMIENGVIGEKEIKTSKKLLVFSSHSHHDHYSPVIMEWEKYNKNIKYILSSDIKPGRYDDNIYLMSPYDEMILEGAYIKAFGSSDMGVSFLVKVDGISLFHGGDLNWWYWWDDTQDEIEKAEKLFKNEIDKIKGEKIDIAFFPVDPRLEDYFYLGGEYFIREIKPGTFIPMHLWENYKIIKDFKTKVGNCDTRIIEINHRGQFIR